MAAKYVLAILAVLFLCAGSMRAARGSAPARPLLIVAAIFAVVGVWLFAQAV